MTKLLQREIGRVRKQGYPKSMNKGVSDEERTKLFKKFGDKIGEKEFIITISLFTDEEKIEREKVKHEYIVEKIDTQYDNLPSINVNDSIQDFTVKMIDGTNIKLSDLKVKLF